MAATNVPTTIQNGSTIPNNTKPKSVPMPKGAAGRMVSVVRVRSIQGMGNRTMGSLAINPVSAGKPTYTAPNSNPIPMPTEKTRQRQLSCPSSASARAVAPCAPTGANGKGKRSTSDVTRKRM